MAVTLRAHAVPGTAHLQQPTSVTLPKLHSRGFKGSLQFRALLPSLWGCRSHSRMPTRPCPSARCSWQRDAHPHIKQLRDSGCGWSRGDPDSGDSSGPAPAQHRPQGSAGGGDRSAVSERWWEISLDLFPSAPLRDAKKSRSPSPRPAANSPAAQPACLAPAGSAGGAGKGSSAVPSRVSGEDLGTQRG